MFKALHLPRPMTAADLSPETVGVGLALMSAAASGTLGLWAKLGGAAGMGSATMLGWRFALLSALLAAFGYYRTERANLPALLTLGLLHSFTALCFFTALEYISASTAALLVTAAPAFVIVLNLLTRQLPSRYQVAALVLTLVGLSVIVGRPSPADANLVGLLLGGAASFLYGAYFFTSHRLNQGIKPLTVTTYVSIVTAASVGIYGVMRGELAVPNTGEQWLIIGAMALIPSLIAMPALYGAVARIGAMRTSMLNTTDPMWAVLLAVVFLGDQLTTAKLVGGAFILGGAALAQRENKTAKRRVKRGKTWSAV